MRVLPACEPTTAPIDVTDATAVTAVSAVTDTERPPSAAATAARTAPSPTAGRVAAWAGVVCFTWHLAMLTPVLLTGSAPAPVTSLTAALSTLCLTCTGALWRGPDRGTWRRVAALGLLGLGLHVVPPGGHHEHAGRAEVVAASGHAGHAAATATLGVVDVPGGPQHWWGVGPMAVQTALALAALSRRPNRARPGSTWLPGLVTSSRAAAPDGA